MSPTSIQLIIQLVPYLIIAVSMSCFAIPLCRRKGKSYRWAAACLIPIAGPFILFYLVSLTDKQVLDRLKLVENTLLGEVER